MVLVIGLGLNIRCGVVVGVGGMVWLQVQLISVMVSVVIVVVYGLMLVSSISELLVIMLIRIVSCVFIFIMLLLLISLVGLSVCGRIVYLIGLNIVECMFIMNSMFSSSGRLCVWKIYVVSVIVVILNSFMQWMMWVFLNFFVSWLVVVENRKYGRMNNVGVRLVYSDILWFGSFICMVVSIIIVLWNVLLLNVFSVWVQKNGVKCWWLSRVNWFMQVLWENVGVQFSVNVLLYVLFLLYDFVCDLGCVGNGVVFGLFVVLMWWICVCLVLMQCVMCDIVVVESIVEVNFCCCCVGVFVCGGDVFVQCVDGENVVVGCDWVILCVQLGVGMEYFCFWCQWCVQVFDWSVVFYWVGIVVGGYYYFQ